MPGDEHVSPRAAIHKWLQDAEAKPKRNFKLQLPQRPKQPDRSRRHKRRLDVGHSGRLTNEDVDDHAPRRAGYRTDDPKLKHDCIRTSPLPEQQKPLGLEGPGLAERLGLHAPFRNFGERNDDEGVDLQIVSRSRKRRRRESSSDSVLEAAETEDALGHSPDAVHSADILQSRRGIQEHIQIDANSSPGISPEPRMTALGPKKATRAYERRTRHKTREDRYNLKEQSNSRGRRASKKKDRAETKHKPPKRKEKSGAALMHDFTAQNVSHDRLTLQPSMPLGVFGKGRASSPVRRRGLPDLAFSEMTFLNPRRVKSDGVAEASSKPALGKTNRRKSTKAADTGAEISRFFTATKAADQNAKGHHHQRRQQDLPTKSRNHDSPPAFVDLPNAPFLGFGSCGANSVSPFKNLDSPVIRNLEKRLTRSPTRSTSYLTWSLSGAPSQVSLHSQKHRCIPLESSRLSNQNAQSPCLRGTQPSNPLASSPCNGENSVENRRVHSAPVEEISNQFRHATERPPQPETLHTGRALTSDERQETRQVRVEDESNAHGVRRDAGSRTYVPKSPDQSHGDVRPVREDATLGNTKQCLAKAHEPSEKTRSAEADASSSLDDTLEALLHECNKKYTVELLQPRVRQPMPDDVGSSEELVDDQANYFPCNHSHGTSDRSHARASPFRSPFPAVPRTNHAKAYTESASRDRLFEPQTFPRPPSRHGTVPSQRPFPCTIPDVSHVLDMGKGNSRSAWTGYENIYERQLDLDLPNTHNDEDHVFNDHTKDSSCPHDVRTEQYYHIRPNEQSNDYIPPQDGEMGRLSYSLDEELGCLPYEENCTEYEALDSHSGWHTTEENLLAEHERNELSDDLAHSNRLDLRDHTIFDEQEPYFEPKETIHESNGHVFLRGAHGNNGTWHGNANLAEDGFDDPTLSNFWTPHRLY